MSGGSYNYGYNYIESLASDIEESVNHIGSVEVRVARKAFAELLKKCAKAANDIEWGDSGDYGDELESINAVISDNMARDTLANEIKRVSEDLKVLLSKAYEETYKA